MRALTINDQYASDKNMIDIWGYKIIHSQLAILFLGLCLLILILRSASEIVLARMSKDIRFELRKNLYQQISRSPIAGLESVGQSRLIQSMSNDVGGIVMGAQMFPQLLTTTVTLICMLGYLAYLQFDTFVYVVKIIIFGVIAYQLPTYLGFRHFKQAREHHNLLQEAFRGLVGGAKELKLCRNKQQHFEQEILFKQERIIRDLEKKGTTIHNLGNNVGGLLGFFAIGGLVFVFINSHPVSNTQIMTAVMVLLYISSPISELLMFFPQLSMTNISLQKIKQLYRELPDEGVLGEEKCIQDWRLLRFEQVVYRHTDASEHDNGFEIGPLTLEIKAGEITFITGGNGSGKSTLAKVISQHYRPQTGMIYCDDQVIDSHNLSSFRAQVCCIYSDYYLFDRPLGVSADDIARINFYLEAFELSDKVTLRDGKFSTLKLSDGQRRRLALVVAIVEDKSLYLFDEWAADQDPQFKHIFYHQILPDLKSSGKAVVVISHDDRYFDLADKHLVMESGRLISTKTSAASCVSKVKPNTMEQQEPKQ
jgi:putative ATP-binding cassette transporter